MNLKEIPMSITVVSQIKEAGPFVGVVERYGEEVFRTWNSYESLIEALNECKRWLTENPAPNPLKKNGFDSVRMHGGAE